jgi:2-dehydropantoate 2-reductase
MEVQAKRRPRVGILGAGALGSLFGWYLSAIADVTFLDVRPDLCATIERDGIRVDGQPSRKARATLNPSALFGSEVIFVFVKARDTLRALRPFARQLDPSAAIVSLQNGFGNEEAIKAAVGVSIALVVGATTETAITLDDGVTRRVGEGRTVVGSAGATASTVERVAALISTAGLDARSAYDIRPHLWGKLIVNAAINPVSALLASENGIILGDPDAEALARAIAIESAAVATALRIRLLFADPWSYVREIVQGTAQVRNSMTIDLEAGRRTEVDHINGAIVASGRRVAVATPYNDAMVRLIKARERVGIPLLR